MSFFKRAKEISGDLASAGKRQAQRGKMEIEIRRVEGRINDEKQKAGAILFEQLEAGTLTCDLPAVGEHRATIATLREELDAKRKEQDELGEGDEVAQPAAT